MARRQGFFDDLIHIGLKLPWQAALPLAGGSFLVLHFVAARTSAPATAAALAGLGTVVGHQLIHTFALFSQYLAPIGLLTGATIGYFKQSQARSPVGNARANPKAISEMSWREFERLIGEAFRQRGYTVTGFGGSGRDGGVDLALVKNGERFLVQCKHWRKEQVGITVVRELNGVMAAVDAHGGYVVTAGQFTREAREFVKGTQIELMDGEALEKLTGCVRTSASASVVDINAASRSAPACPCCGTTMFQRVTKQGKHAGHSFWRCQQYPKCSGILQIS